MDNIEATQRKTTPKLRIGQQYVDLETELDNITKYIANPDGTPTTRGAELGITPEKAAEFLAMNTDYIAKMLDYRSIDRTQSDVRAMQDTLKKYLKVVHDFQQGVKKNPDIELTAEDRTNLGIHEDSETRTPVEPEPYPPIITIYKTIVGGVLEMQFNMPDSAAAGNRRSLPYRQGITAEIWYTMSMDPPEGNSTTHYFTTQRHRFAAPTGALPGTVLHIRACYTTRTGKNGPFSQIKACVLSF